MCWLSCDPKHSWEKLGVVVCACHTNTGEVWRCHVCSVQEIKDISYIRKVNFFVNVYVYGCAHVGVYVAVCSGVGRSEDNFRYYSPNPTAFYEMGSLTGLRSPIRLVWQGSELQESISSSVLDLQTYDSMPDIF